MDRDRKELSLLCTESFFFRNELDTVFLYLADDAIQRITYLRSFMYDVFLSLITHTHIYTCTYIHMNIHTHAS